MEYLLTKLKFCFVINISYTGILTEYLLQNLTFGVY